MSGAYANANRAMLERRGAVPTETEPGPNTIVTEDGFEILLSKKCVKQIGNAISRQINRQLTRGEAEELVAFIQALPARSYINIPYQQAQQTIAAGFVNRHKQSIAEEEDVFRNVGLDEITPDRNAMHEYQKKEINLMTTDENPLKLSQHHNARGNAIVDADRVRREHMMGDRSSANNVLQYPGASPLELAVLTSSKETSRAIEAFNRFLNPESIDKILERSRTSWMTYDSVVLPRQVVPLDSRYRIPSYTPLWEYSWYLHTAGVQGSIGNIRMQDTFKELVQMKVSPFWMPITQSNDGYYDKIRMLIKEFTAQSTEFPEYFDNGTIRVHNYHFEFIITKREPGRFYLEPTSSGIFRFRKPFARPETITISFTGPFNQIIPAVDSMEATASNTNPTIFTTVFPNTLATGDLVYIQLFNSPNVPINNLVNRLDGYIVTRLGASTFSIPVDLSSLAGPVTGCQVFFGSKRLIIPIEFVSLEQ
jgi:hypothetical protein